MSLADLSIYFSGRSQEPSFSESELGSKVIFNLKNDEFPSIVAKSVVLIHCPEYRNSSNKEVRQSELVTAKFYQLNIPQNWNFSIYDLGTINPGNTVLDTYFAIKTVIAELVKLECMPIVIGGSQDLTYAIYEGYQKLEQTVNITNIDASLDLGNPEEELNDRNYISHILTTRPCTLFNYSIIGTQKPFINDVEADLIDKLYFDQCRLGELESNFRKTEPLLRNADILSFDLQALQSADYTGEIYSNPNGIKPELACQISRYAGLSDRLSTFAILNYVQLEKNSWYDHLVAQMIWYYLDGVANRYHDFPIVSLNNYTKFTVKLVEPDEEIVFYKSNKSERWWMEVPYPSDSKSNLKRQTVVPCNYEDYQQAMKNDTPDLWWKTFQKLI